MLSPKVLQLKIIWRSINFCKEVSPALYLFIIATIMIPLSYLMGFTHYPPTAILGRGTSVHLMSSVSWAFFISSALSLLSKYCGTRRIIFICLIMLSSFMNYFYMLQYSYVYIKNEEMKVFKRLEDLCPDMYDADIIIIGVAGEPNSAAMDTYHWALPIAADYYYEEGPYPHLPIHTPLSSTVHFRNSNGKNEFFNEGYPQWGGWLPVTEKTILLMPTADGNLTRLTHLSYITYNGEDSFDIAFKPYNVNTQRKILPVGPLFKLLNKENIEK
jgi:hypothetical protein